MRADHQHFDLGCGPRGILDLLAERVSPGGRVVGVDTDPALVAMAAEFVAARRLKCRSDGCERPAHRAAVGLVRSGTHPYPAWSTSPRQRASSPR